MSYAELKCRTNFSFLRGASHPHELINQAAQLGLRALGITDINGVYGIPKAYWAQKQHSSLKLIVGAELTLEESPPLILLARDRKAYGLLCRLLTESYRGHQKGEAKLNQELFLKMMREESGNENLIGIGTPHPLHQTPQILDYYQSLKKLFGDRLYIPLTRYLDGMDRQRTRLTTEISERFKIKILATNDVHYHIKDRHKLQDVMTSVRESESMTKAGFRLFSNGERYIKSPEQMGKLFKDLPRALTHSLEIAEQCTFCPSELRYQYPSEWIPAGYTAQHYLEREVFRGAQTRYKSLPPQVEKLIRHELAIIEKLNFADYFLTIYDIIQFARNEKILCQGRGSAANSAVCYCLGITAIDPETSKLLFERFISVERKEPPDIDVDFEHERREEVIQYIYKKYGRHRAAMVSAVVTYQKKSAFREISKALGVEVGTLSSKKLRREFKTASEKSGVPDCLELVENLSSEMDGFPRHLSIHSGGFTLSTLPIDEIVPVEPARMEGRTIIQWDKYDLDYLGLIKIDILSLGMLSALRKTLHLAHLELHQIPQGDPKTYAMIQRADTVGTFQIESRAQMNMLGRLMPKNFYDLVIQVAIVRPGPIVGKMVHPYLKRRRGLEKIDLPHPLLKEILGRTLGVPLFQEQVMEIAIKLGGFSPGEADELRRAIGAWRASGQLEKVGKRLMAGLMKSGLSVEFAERIFLQIQGFAQYGFPESHAASFALIAYASAYLKCHYPAEFTCSLVNSQPMGFYSNHTLIDDVKRNGIEVLPIDPNKSQWDCVTLKEPGEIRAKKFRLGWRIVKGLALTEAEVIMREAFLRPFESLKDFLVRTNVRRDVLHRMAMGNTFACFGLDQRHSLWQILEHQVLCGHITQNLNQLNLFDTLDLETPGEKIFKSLESYDRVVEDYKSFRLSTYGHPMEFLRKAHNLPSLTTSQARQMPSGRHIRISGLQLVRQRPPTAKGVTFSVLEDESGLLDMIIHPTVYERFKEIFLHECFLTVTGTLTRESYTVTLIVKSMESVWKEDSPRLDIDPHQYF